MSIVDQYFHKNISKQQKSKDGFITPLIIGVSFVIFSGLLFLTIELPVQRANVAKFNAFANSAVAASVSVTNIDDILETGDNPQISPAIAGEVIEQYAVENFILKKVGTKLEIADADASPLVSAPEIEYYVYNKPYDADDSWEETVTFMNRKYKIDESTVFAYFNVSYKDPLMKHGLKLEKVVIYQVKREK